MVVLHTLGECAVRTRAASLTPRADVGFTLAAHLIAQRGRRVSRSVLLAWFWPDMDAAPARHALSEALRKLRRRGVPVAGDNSPYVWIAPERAAVDVDRLADAAPAELASADFRILPDWSPAFGAPELRDWADEFRDHLKSRAVAALERVLRAQGSAGGDWHTTMRLADRLLELDPVHEVALDLRSAAAAALRGGSTNGNRATRTRRTPRRPDAVRESATAALRHCLPPRRLPRSTRHQTRRPRLHHGRAPPPPRPHRNHRHRRNRLPLG